MLAEIFMVRSEAAARLREQTLSFSKAVTKAEVASLKEIAARFLDLIRRATFMLSGASIAVRSGAQGRR